MNTKQKDNTAHYKNGKLKTRLNRVAQCNRRQRMNIKRERRIPEREKREKLQETRDHNGKRRRTPG